MSKLKKNKTPVFQDLANAEIEETAVEKRAHYWGVSLDRGKDNNIRIKF